MHPADTLAPDCGHVIVCTRALELTVPVIEALTRAGYVVTAYASPARTLPRLAGVSRPVALLVIDARGSRTLARAAVAEARLTFAGVPVLVLWPAFGASLQPSGDTNMYRDVAVLRVPFRDQAVVEAAKRLAPPWSAGRVLAFTESIEP